MTSFTYKAYDKNGRRVKGVLVADGAAQARAKLAAQGLFTEDLSDNVPKAAATRTGLFQRAHLSAEGLALFTRQLSVLLASRVPVDRALDVMIGSRTASQVNRVAADLQGHLREGLPLSAAMARHGGSFPEYYRAAIAAGESSGHLTEVLDVLADFIEDRLTQRDKTLTSLIYPLFVGAVSIAVASVLLVSVVPELVALFEQSGQQLPAITQVTIALSDAVASYWPWMVGAIGALVVGLGALFRRPGPRLVLHRVALRIPVFGPLARSKAALLFLRTLSLVLRAKVPIVQALRHAQNAVDNLSVKAELAGVAKVVEQGKTVSDALADRPSLPVIALQMIENGERSGEIAKMTERAAKMQELDLSNRTQRVTALLEPVLLMFVGAVVLVIVLSVLLPILDLQTNVAL
ncbi:MAG: type II secretion system F family protein [Pseudomonadota bacterium]